MIFIHGGAWRSGRSADFALYAEVFVKAGANFVAVDFSNVIETKGDLFPMVDQCRRAVAWVYRNAASFGGYPAETYLCGRSSGSHLAGCVLITEWEKQGLPRDIVASPLRISFPSPAGPGSRSGTFSRSETFLVSKGNRDSIAEGI